MTRKGRLIRRAIAGGIALAAIIAGSTLCIARYADRRGDPIRISLNNWIGYTPFFYIHEKGWMSKDIRFTIVSSLMESEKLFQAGLTDGFTGTQYEYEHSRMVSGTIVPVILIDRSNGADSILGNVSIDELAASRGKVTVYMEIQSVNSFLFRSFKKEFNLNDDLFTLVNKNQGMISAITPGRTPVLVITYEPYKTELMKNGFQELANTSNVNLLVLDAVFLEQKILEIHPNLIASLKRNMQNALAELNENPQDFYETVRPYLGNQTYEEFLLSLEGIMWLGDGPSAEIRRTLVANGIPVDWIQE